MLRFFWKARNNAISGAYNSDSQAIAAAAALALNKNCSRWNSNKMETLRNRSNWPSNLVPPERETGAISGVCHVSARNMIGRFARPVDVQPAHLVQLFAMKRALLTRDRVKKSPSGKTGTLHKSGRGNICKIMLRHLK
ncbi:hypothetical protein ACJRO7_007201 [Eucalyptus globulus]|uniref:Uncharacterized protein n=1 Tax=Eucalyptus globulus TaxID=34317 RepID=A0ABD3INB2_EUCGL